LEVVELALEHAQAIIDAVAVVLARSACLARASATRMLDRRASPANPELSNSIAKAGLDW
jgi:hypothetical protein